MYNNSVRRTSSLKEAPSPYEPSARSPSLIHMPPDIDWRSIEEDTNKLRFNYTHKSVAQSTNLKELSVNAKRWRRAFDFIQQKTYRFS